MLIPSVLPAHAVTYAAGVSVGQWAKYAPFNVTYHETGGIFPEPQSVIDLNRTVVATQTVQQLLTTTNVTVQTFTSYNNATTKTEILNGDLMTGKGNLSYALIAGGLSAGQPISTMPSSPIINQTVTMTYLGLARTVNIFNITFSESTQYGSSRVTSEFIWDQSSGIVLQAKALVVASLPLGGFAEYIDVRITSTNIFLTSTPVPSFTVVASHPSSVTSGTSATSTITVAAVNGFSGTVTLTDTVPSGLTCVAITPSTITNSGTASLSCSSTNPGTYTVTITATSGSTSHTTTTTITIAAAPSQTPSSPATILGLDPTLFYGIIGIVVVVIATAAYLGFRSRSKEQEIPSLSSQPTTPVP